MNKMREIQVEKVTLNVGVGQAGNELDKAIKLLNVITGEKPVKTVSDKRIPTWGVRPGLEIAAKVTLRKEKAIGVLQRLFATVNNTLDARKFDTNGNFSFGLKEYIEIPGMEYLVEVGIIGLECAVTLKRAGFRIKRRSWKTKKIPIRHRITKEEAIKFVQDKFKVNVREEE